MLGFASLEIFASRLGCLRMVPVSTSEPNFPTFLQKVLTFKSSPLFATET